MTTESQACTKASSDRHLAGIFAELANVIYDDAQDYESTFRNIVEAAVTVVEGCDRASIMQMRSDGSFATAVSTDDVAAYVDRLERQFGEGPCLDAIVDNAPQFEPDLAACTQWPNLSRAVLSETPVRGAAGFRILAGNRKVGALNLFSDTVGALREESGDAAIVLAAFSSVAVSAAHHRNEATTLAAGIESNREIGKAVGLLMAFHKIGDVEAFAMLRKTSQDMNIKLAEVARKVVAHHNAGRSA
ncbi:GAF and ANTAR domain-containing protein [Lapillicoccus sp.]|uniref:GAF and ANTAR domain-containing protein n=1 Tax=Lapillicoccus sp. TaxID=1909287 RepID=UPI0032663A5F